MLRTHTCGELNPTSIEKTIQLAGWVQTKRDHGGVIFIDLRDRYGVTQIVFEPSTSDETTTAHNLAEHLRREDCITIHGVVRKREEDTTNKKIVTGEIEVLVTKVQRLSASETPPIDIDDTLVANEEVRLTYRYLDLRRPNMQQKLLLRSQLAFTTRKYFVKNNFVEIETPLLMKSTPEGARDYVVPSRVHHGKFYALPQSPQIYKQLLMVAGIDRYFQIAKCLRDEDLRADRQPEFTQIDVEMSFVNEHDVHTTAEGLLHAIVQKAKGFDIPLPFQKLTYAQAMERYGTDKPDLRYELFLTTITDILAASDFQLAKLGLKDGGIAKCLSPNVSFTRTALEEIIEFAKTCGAKGLAWMRVIEEGELKGKALESNIAKFFSAEQQQELIHRTNAQPGDYIFIVSGKSNVVNDTLSRIRIKIAKDHALTDPEKLSFCWIVDFPLFEWDEDEKRFIPAHHMFCQPKQEWIDKIEISPGDVLCTQYDVVLNGVELGSGSLRIIDPVVQEKVMKVIGLTKEQIEGRFGFLLEAFKYGPPPHGGFALGFDRLVALLCGTNDIREVIAFPKTKTAENPMDGSPSIVDEKQLQELGLELKKKESSK